MSKAFTPNDVEAPDEDDIPEPEPLPAGLKNYITAAGLAVLEAELDRLVVKDRPAVTAAVTLAASNGDRSENGDYIYGKRRLREIDRRIRFLTKRIGAAEVVDLRTQPRGQVFFGATVTVRMSREQGEREGEAPPALPVEGATRAPDVEEGINKTYTIVGVDEIDLARQRISWRSPLARALHKSRVGDIVTFQTPSGARELEVLAIEYGEETA